MDTLIDINYKLPVHEAKILNPQLLAFIGDSVYALYMKTYIVSHFSSTSNKLNTLTNDLVNATKQSKMVSSVIEELTDTELEVYKRARNYKTANTAKNANVIDYKRATGLEAVIGFLYLTNSQKRLNELLSKCVGENDENRG